jgi:NAD-dependent dihydropyrimidine dehydrogenase PreA subunit
MDIKQSSQILFCHCAYANALPSRVKQEVLQTLKELRLSYRPVADLCELAARKDPLLAELAGAPRLMIAACHPRAVRWLFAAGGAALRDEAVQYLDLREASPEQILPSIRALMPGGDVAEKLETDAALPLPQGSAEPILPDGGNAAAPAWQPWFPVIDYTRCKNCQQCLGFCLFGVYAVDPDGKVQVKNPASCKTDCPACARVCPETAIIFPKYAAAPINGGEAKDGAEQAEPVKLDRTMLASGDFLKALKDRSKNGARFSADMGQVKIMREKLHLISGMPLAIDISRDVPPSQPSTKKEPE